MIKSTGSTTNMETQCQERGIRTANAFRFIGPVGACMILALGSSTWADDVLIFGDRSGDAGNLATSLTTLGHTVTNVPALPADISPEALTHDLDRTDSGSSRYRMLVPIVTVALATASTATAQCA